MPENNLRVTLFILGQVPFILKIDPLYLTLRR